MRTRVINTIDKYNMLNHDDTVVVGVSGGADSVCLLFLLCEFAHEKIYNINIEVVHVNHKLRDTAQRDADFVRQLCLDFEKRFDITVPFHLAEVDINSLSKELGLSTEEAGRMVRYDAMNKVLLGKQGHIAVAHHANDRAETMLFNLFRGSGLKGLSGIQPVNGNIIRPLLMIPRRKIEEFLKKEGLSYVTDETNLTDEYTRNKIRHNIIEYAEENILHSLVSNMNNAANQLMMAEDFISEYTLKAALRSVLIKEKNCIVISLKEIRKEHEYIIDRLLYDAVVYVAKKKKDITSEHVYRVKLLVDSEGTKVINLPYDIVVKKEYDHLYISNSEYKVEVMKADEDAIDMKVLTEFRMEDIPKDIYTKWFDYDKISSVASVRHRKEGDYLCINKELQKQSLKEYLINEKIPKDKRDDILILADKSHVMWVIGMRISEYYKITKDTKRVLEVHYGREN